MKKSIAILSTALILGASMAAQAASTSSTTSEAVAPSFTKKLKASYYAGFFGSALTSPTHSLQPDAANGKLDPSAPVLMKNKISVGYKFNDDVALTPYFYWKNIARPDLTGNGFVMQNPYVRLSHNNLIKNGNFSMYGQVEVEAPLSQKARDNSLITAISPAISPSYSIPNSRFSLACWTSMGINLYQSGKANSNKLLTFYAGPELDYTIRNNVTAFVLYEMNAKHVANVGLAADGTDLEAGVSWDITPKINLKPLVDVKTGNRIATDTTSFITEFTWKLL